MSTLAASSMPAIEDVVTLINWDISIPVPINIRSRLGSKGIRVIIIWAANNVSQLVNGISGITTIHWITCNPWTTSRRQICSPNIARICLRLRKRIRLRNLTASPITSTTQKPSTTSKVTLGFIHSSGILTWPKTKKITNSTTATNVEAAEERITLSFNTWRISLSGLSTYFRAQT